MTAALDVLVVEDSQADFLLIERLLRQGGRQCRCHRVAGLDELRAALDAAPWDVVLSDYNVPGLDFLDTLALIRTHSEDLPIILISGSLGEERAVDLLKRGVWDFLLKDSLVRLVPAIDRSLKEAAERVARRAAESRYRSLFEHMLDGYAYCRMLFADGVSADFLFVETNPSFGRVTGFGEVAGRRISEVAPTIRQSNPELFAALGRVSSTGRPERFELFVGAVEAWLKVSVYSPERGYFVVVVDNITERKEAEARLRTSEARLSLALAASQMGVWEWDVERNRMDWSPECRAITGLAGLGGSIESFTRIIHPDDVAQVQAAINRAIAERTTYAAEFRVRRADGTMRWLSNLGHADYAADGRVLRMVGTVQDISERIRGQEVLRRSQRLEAMGQLTGGLAHDFANILGIVAANLQLIEYRPSEENVVEGIRLALSATDRGTKLIRRLLAFSRRRSEGIRGCDVGEELARLQALIGEVVPKNVSFDVSAAGDLWPARMDPSEFGDAILNLALNAAQAMPNGGRLRIEAFNASLDGAASSLKELTAGDYVMVAVHDDGHGIPAELLDRVFEPFFTTKERSGGSGLGLAMVYGFAQRCGGAVRISSQPGQGATVRLYLPRHAAAAAAPEAVEARQPPRRRGETILVVDDEPGIARAAEVFLRDLGYRPLVATTPEDAWECLTGNRDVSLVFSDVLMPGPMSGIDLAVKAREMLPELRILLTTGFTEASLAADAAARGFPIVAKPYGLVDLAVAVRALLDDPVPAP